VQERRFVFCIVTAQANIYLEAASHEEMLGWMSSIDEAKMVLTPTVPPVDLLHSNSLNRFFSGTSFAEACRKRE